MAKVDERTYKAAKGKESSASDRKLYYQRAGVWGEESTLHVVGAGEGPVEYVDVTGEELGAIRDALAKEAERSGAEV